MLDYSQDHFIYKFKNILIVKEIVLCFALISHL